MPAALELFELAREAAWDDSKHPRGQPGNSGQFGSSTTGPTVVSAQPDTRPLPPGPQQKAKSGGAGQGKGGKKKPLRSGSTQATADQVSGPPPRSMKRGDSGPDVQRLQILLRGLGISANLNSDGSFGPQTEQAVRAAQERLGLKPNGHATISLMRKLADAVKLSPCIHESEVLDLATRVLEAGEPGYGGSMVALVPSREDAERLAVEDGLPEYDLHVTLAYLGAGADFDAEARSDIVNRIRDAFADLGQIKGDGFGVAAFNPNGDDPCVVLLLGGDELAQAHDATLEALDGVGIPEQRQPWVAHTTLRYTDDPSTDEYADLTGPVVFDRVRIAFAGEITDIPLSTTEANRYRHGWILLHPSLSDEELARDYGDELDRHDFPDGSLVARSQGVLTVEVPDGAGRRVVATPSPTQARAWADHIEEHRSGDGLDVEQDGDRTVLRFVDDDDEGDDFDLSRQESDEFLDALRDLAYEVEDHQTVPDDIDEYAHERDYERETESLRVLEFRLNQARGPNGRWIDEVASQLDLGSPEATARLHSDLRDVAVRGEREAERTRGLHAQIASHRRIQGDLSNGRPLTDDQRRALQSVAAQLPHTERELRDRTGRTLAYGSRGGVTWHLSTDHNGEPNYRLRFPDGSVRDFTFDEFDRLLAKLTTRESHLSALQLLHIVERFNPDQLRGKDVGIHVGNPGRWIKAALGVTDTPDEPLSRGEIRTPHARVTVRLPRRKPRIDDRVEGPGGRRGRILAIEPEVDTRVIRPGETKVRAGQLHPASFRVRWDDDGSVQTIPQQRVFDPVKDPTKTFVTDAEQASQRMDTALAGPPQPTTPAERLADKIAAGAVVGRDRQTALDVVRRAAGMKPEPRPRSREEIADMVGRGEISVEDGAAMIAGPPTSVPEVPTGGAKEGAAALEAAPASLITGRGLSTAQKSALRNYQDQGAHDRINNALRQGQDVSKMARVAQIDAALASSPLTDDVVTYRGAHGEAIFGDPSTWPADLTGFEWTDPAYQSTSTQYTSARGFGGEHSVVLQMRVPAGTSAVAMSRYEIPGKYRRPDEAELLLDRGLHMRVVGDRLVDDGRLVPTRVLDVEVVPAARPSAPSVPTAPSSAKPFPPGQHSWSGHDGIDVTDAEEAGFPSFPQSRQLEINDRVRSGGGAALRGEGARYGSHPDRSVTVSPERQAEIRAAIEDIAFRDGRRVGAGQYVDMKTVREGLGGRFSRVEVDNVIAEMNRTPDWTVSPESNQKTLTPRARLAAVVIGNQDKHVIAISRRGPIPPASAPSVPTKATPARKAAKKAAATTGDLTGASGLSSDPQVRAVQVDNRIRAAYQAVLDRKPNKATNEWVMLSDLRAELGDSVSRPEVDAALVRMGRGDYDGPGSPYIVPESNQSALTQANRDGAVHFGGQNKHAIRFGDASPRPLPAAPRPAKKAVSKATPSKAVGKVAAAKATKAPAAKRAPKVPFDAAALAERISRETSPDLRGDLLARLTLDQLRQVYGQVLMRPAPARVRTKAALIDAIAKNRRLTY